MSTVDELLIGPPVNPKKKKKTTKKRKKKKNVSKAHNLKPSTIHKNRSNQQQQKKNPSDIASLTSDFSVDFIKLIDGYIHESNLNITIFTGISELIYSYTLVNLITGCWSYHVWQNLIPGEYEDDHYYSLKINNDYSFRLNAADITSEHRDWPAGTFINSQLFSLRGYIERDKKNRYIMLLEHKNGIEFLKRTYTMNKMLEINNKQREKVYFQRVMNVYKYLNLDDAQLLKIHKKYKPKKGVLNWECVSQKLFNDLKYGKLDIQRKKRNKMIAKVPDMHVLYRKLSIFHGIKPLGLYIGNVYVKCSNNYRSVKIMYNKEDLFGSIENNFDKENVAKKVKLKAVNENDMLIFWKECLGNCNIEKKDKQKIKEMVGDIE